MSILAPSGIGSAGYRGSFWQLLMPLTFLSAKGQTCYSGVCKAFICMGRCKSKPLLSYGFGLEQMNFTWSKHNDLLLFSGFLVACWFSQRLLMLYRHLGYKFLSSSPRDGIFLGQDPTIHEVCIWGRALLIYPYSAVLWTDKETSGSPSICYLVWHSSADEIGFTIFSPFPE